MCLQYKSFKNTLGKEEIARDEQFLFFPQCFLHCLRTFYHFHDPLLRRLFFPAYFRLAPLQKHVRNVVGGFRKKSCFSTGVRKPGNSYVSPTAMI